MRHVVNVGLLLSFATLSVTGVLRFVMPFSIVTTRIHIVFGLVTLLLVGMHLSSRVPYFKNFLKSKSKSRALSTTPSRWFLLTITLVWGVLLGVSMVGLAPANLLIEQGYESRHRSEIVRSSPQTGYTQAIENRIEVARRPAVDADAALSLSIILNATLDEVPTVAVWAESTTGAMIETLYLDPRIAYSDSPTWHGAETPRHKILPLWRHRYTIVTGIDPSGEVDGLSGATASHQFTLDNYLRLGSENSFVLCVEVNASGDVNAKYAQEEHLGQPSLLYTAYIDLASESKYSLLELTGHGGGAERDGAIRYDLDGIDTAKQLVEVLLAKVAPR